MATSTTTARESTTTTTSTKPRVAVTVDGRPVLLQGACRGVDGAVVAVATTGRRIVLVRHDGLALRVGTQADTLTETSQVRATQTADGARYEGAIFVEGRPTPVTMQIAGGEALTFC